MGVGEAGERMKVVALDEDVVRGGRSGSDNRGARAAVDIAAEMARHPGWRGIAVDLAQKSSPLPPSKRPRYRLDGQMRLRCRRTYILHTTASYQSRILKSLESYVKQFPRFGRER